MLNVAQQRCFNHAIREAVARCPECRRPFCRECVTEHDDRVLCAACLKALQAHQTKKRRTLSGLLRLTQFAVGLVVAWFFFSLAGEALLRLPDSFHEGSVWTVPLLER